MILRSGRGAFVVVAAVAAAAAAVVVARVAPRGRARGRVVPERLAAGWVDVARPARRCGGSCGGRRAIRRATSAVLRARGGLIKTTIIIIIKLVKHLVINHNRKKEQHLM